MKDDYKLTNPEFEKIIESDGTVVLISPDHPMYKELKQLEQSRNQSRRK